jgi:hypothetical protein
MAAELGTPLGMLDVLLLCSLAALPPGAMGSPVRSRLVGARFSQLF